MNRAFIVGNLTRDPELRKTQNDISICNFTVACNRRFTNAQGQREADFLRIVVWRAQADNCYRYLKKGSRVAVIGSIQERSYDAQDGSKRYVTEIVADEVEFLGSAARSEGDAYPSGGDRSAAPSDMQPIDDDQLPF